MKNLKERWPIKSIVNNGKGTTDTNTPKHSEKHKALIPSSHD